METYDSVWDIIKNEQLLIISCRKQNKEFFTKYHPEQNINVLQWFLRYIGSGVRAFVQVKYGNYNRKEWAFHKVEILHDNLPTSIWSELVHASTGFSKKCKTIHYFTRNAYTVNKNHLHQINLWFDEVKGRFTYTHLPDEYGYTPGEYVDLHRKRQEVFRKRNNKHQGEIDELVKKYHDLECDLAESFNCQNRNEFYNALKILGNSEIKEEDINVCKKILEIAKIRIKSHCIHDSMFDDELKVIERSEELQNRGLSQMSNHLWIIKAYMNILKDTPQGKLLDEFIKAKGVVI